MLALCHVVAMAAPSYVVAQVPPKSHPQPAPPNVLRRVPPITSDVSWGEVQSIARRLEAVEAENIRLRQMIAPQAYAGAQVSFATEAVEPTAHWQEGSHCDCEGGGCDDGSICCPNCGKAVCEGLPHLCGVCLENLGWNKANGWKIVPFGRLRGDFIYSSASYTNDAVIVFLNPNNPAVDEDSTSITAKQSQLNFAMTGPNHNGWETGGLVLVNFMGAQPLRNFSGANIVNAYGEFKNERWRFAFGRMLDLFGPISPSTVNQLQQRGGGNIGIYRGAFNIDRYVTVSDAHKWTLSGRISQPDISDYAAVPFINGQNNGWPNIEARVGVELGRALAHGRPVEIGVSGVIGEIQAVLPAFPGGLIFPGADEVEQTRGVCLDLQLRGERFGIRGEAWWGQAAGTYFVATLQTINPETDQAIESIGGWCEAYYEVSPCLATHLGFGVDDPRNGDLGFLDPVGPGQISYNEVAWWNIVYNVTENFQLGFEVSHRRTDFLDPSANNDAMLYHFSSTLNF